MSPYRVIVDPHAKDGIELRGDCRKAFGDRSPQMILAGPAETGKTFSSCVKLHLTALTYPGSQHTIVRKTQASLAGSILKTFGRIIAGARVETLGGSTPWLFNYPNGSQVWTAGMDNENKVLSSERDTIYVNQAEELTLNDWETLSTRCTGRAAVVKWPQLFGDCNPAGSKHWIRQMAAQGRLKLFHSTHRDNPTLFDAAGEITEQGRRSLGVLENLSGVRRKRLLEGIWATSEGAVYDNFDAAVHVRVRDRSEFKRWFLAIDEGFTNPFVILVVGEDSDGRWHVAREFYQRGQQLESVMKIAREWYREFGCELAAVDEAAAEPISAMRGIGINAKPGKGRVEDGIHKIRNRLIVQGDGKPRLTCDPSCVELVNEFESYVWKPEKDVPVKEHDHALDSLRYLEDIYTGPTGSFIPTSGHRAAVLSQSRRQALDG